MRQQYGASATIWPATTMTGVSGRACGWNAHVGYLSFHLTNLTTPTPPPQQRQRGGETGLLEEARTWIPAKGPDCWLIEIKGNPYAFGHHWRPFWTFPSEIEAQGACDYLNALQSRIQEAVQLLRFILDENVIRHGTERANNFLDAAQQQEEDPA